MHPAPSFHRLILQAHRLEEDPGHLPPRCWLAYCFALQGCRQGEESVTHGEDTLPFPPPLGGLPGPRGMDVPVRPGIGGRGLAFLVCPEATQARCQAS